jgi:hypothetical protein
MNEDMPSGKLISWKTSANYYSSYNKLYKFANSMDGKLLECMELNIPQENNFVVDRIKNGLSDRFILSRLSVQEMTSYKDISIYTYFGILPFSKEPTSPSSSTSIGTAQVKFSSVPSYSSFILSGSAYSTTSYPLSTNTYNIPLYSDRLNSLYLLLRTTSGTYYKFFDNLIPGQLNTLSLSGMRNDFTQGAISFNKGSYTSFYVDISKYGNTGFTGGSFKVETANSTNSPVSYILPSSFLPTSLHYTLLKGYSTDHNATTHFYSGSVPSTLSLLDGKFSFSGSLPEISYKLDINEKADAVYLFFAHNSDFTNTNKYRVSWRIYVSPGVRDIKLPDIPETILATLRSVYGISDLKLSQIKFSYSTCYQYFESDNFDEFMTKYFFGWKNPTEGLKNKYIEFFPTTTKGGIGETKTHQDPYRYTVETDF